MQICNLTKKRISKKLFTGVAKKVLAGENKRIETLSLAFVSKKEMQKLNKKFRHKNKPTDVLSFSEINEIVICPEMVDRGKMLKVFVHGVLHLCGYDHEKSESEAEVMEKLEEKYLKNAK